MIGIEKTEDDKPYEQYEDEVDLSMPMSEWNARHYGVFIKDTLIGFVLLGATIKGLFFP